MVLPAGDQGFTHMTLWGIFHTELTTGDFCKVTMLAFLVHEDLEGSVAKLSKHLAYLPKFARGF